MKQNSDKKYPENISKKEKAKEKEKTLTEILKMFAPGTSLRSALDDIIGAKMGALIIIDKEGLNEIIEKGFRINSKFSQQKLVELAKMDGAIILSEDLKKILYANSVIYPSIEISSKETGTRHKAAERTSKQLGTIAIAVSERKNKVTVYYRGITYELVGSAEILRRAAETLQILEKQREAFDQTITNFNFLEINSCVTVGDVSELLQRFEIINRISDKVKRYLIELGKEGAIVNMRLKELTGNISKKEDIVLEDYFDSNAQQSREILRKMNFDFLLEKSNISRMLFDELHDRNISPKGIRILKKSNLLEKHISQVIEKFGSLDKILSCNESDLLEALEKKEIAGLFKKEIEELKEKIMVGKEI
ncbi:MAG: DNA integrity scanning diadenylate cyclase DisA [Nanoarchaeota archaeon]